MTEQETWICPLCRQENTLTSRTCSSCLYWRRNRDAVPPEKPPPSTERPRESPLSPGPPFRASLSPVLGPAPRRRRRKRTVPRLVLVVWAGLAACAVLAVGLGVGWWLGLGPQGALARQLQAADQPLARPPRVVTRTVTHTVTRTVQVPVAPGPVVFTGSFSDLQDILFPVTVTNPATGQQVTTDAFLDTGSYTSSIAPSLAKALHLKAFYSSTTAGVGGWGPTTYYHPITVMAAGTAYVIQEPGTIYAGVFPAGSEILLGRDWLTQDGFSLTTRGTTWTLTRS